MRIVDQKFVDKTYTRLELANTSGSLRRKATRKAVRMYPRLTSVILLKV
jgi:hypothetical protein